MPTQLPMRSQPEFSKGRQTDPPMKVLFACPPNRNSFIANSMTAIAEQSAAAQMPIEIEIGKNKFWNEDNSYDVVNFQWPEALFEGVWSLNPQRVQRICQRIEFFKSRGAKVCLTRHNIKPHSQRSSADYLKPIFASVNGVIHLGQTSVDEFLHRYNAPEFDHLVHKVVPHPGYFELASDIGKTEARKHLEISANRKVVLVFGTIRSRREANFIKRVFNAIHVEDKLLLAPRWYQSKTKLANWLRRHNISWDRPPANDEYRVPNKFVDDSEIQHYFKSADAVLIPRGGASNLNSGIIPLALTMGSIPVGPNVGVMGELLLESCNPTFTDEASAIEQLERVLNEKSAQTNNLPAANENFASLAFSWEVVGDRLIEFYQQLSSEHSA